MKKKIFFLLQKKWIAWSLFIAGLVSRRFHLSHSSLWSDEGWSLLFAEKTWRELLTICLNGESHSPLYYFFLHYWIQSFGISEFALRLPSMLAGAASISLVFLIGEKFLPKKAAVAAALLVLFSPFHLYYSQEARSYALFGFFSLLSLYTLPVRSRNIASSSDWKPVVHIFSSITMLWLHAWGLFVWIAVNLYILLPFIWDKTIWKDRSALRWIKVQSLVGLFGLPWYFYVALYPDRFFAKIGWITAKPPLGVVSLVDKFLNLPRTLSWFVLILFSISILVYIYKYFKTRRIRVLLESKIWLCILWLSVSIFLPLAYSYLKEAVIVRRYLFSASFAFYLLFAFFVVEYFKKQKEVWIYLVFTTVLIFQIAGLIPYYRFNPKENWRGAMRFVQENSNPHEQVLVQSPSELRLAHYYYGNQNWDDSRFRIMARRSVRREFTPTMGAEARWVFVRNSRLLKLLPHLQRLDGKRVRFGALNLFYLPKQTPNDELEESADEEERVSTTEPDN